MPGETVLVQAGAGGGGFLVLYCEDGAMDRVAGALSRAAGNFLPGA